MNRTTADRLAILDSINLCDSIEEDIMSDDDILNCDRPIDVDANSWDSKAYVAQDPRFNPSAVYADYPQELRDRVGEDGRGEECVPF